ncbi:MAG: LUD domain-containing protein [Methanobrevibacter sp.]|nr:LUD domain-containing protein [Methanobrevibacter sp.]
MNKKELESMRNSFKTVYDKRKELLSNPQTKKLQERVINIRKEAITNNKELLEIAKKSFKENDIDYYFAEDDSKARDIIYNIIKECANNEGIFDEGISDEDNNNDLITIAKSKSNTLGEIDISKFLKLKGISLIETDLGDRILQLKRKDNKPIHPTGPAVHLSVNDIAEIVNNALDKNVPAEPKAIMELVREDVLKKIAKSYIGLSGANAVASEDGSLVFVHNEGNISLISLMKTHIVVVGIDKFVPTIEDAISIAKLETNYATGSKVTSYINVVSGPSKTADIEKKLIKNMYGAEKVAVIILDNGRFEALQSVNECLLCIGCGSCILSCPVYNVIGNEFGFNNCFGGRGVAMSNFIEDTKTSFDSGLYKCTLCGLCTINCPVLIQTNSIIEKVREDSHKKGFYPKAHDKIKENIKNKGSPY